MSDRRLAGILLALLFSGVASPVAAQPTTTDQASLKDLVLLVGAVDANDAFARTVAPGRLTLPLTFRVASAAPAAAQQGELAVTELTAQQEPTQSVKVALRGVGGAPPGAGVRRLPVSLAAPGWIDVELKTGALRPTTAYKGRLVLAAGPLMHRWEMTLTTGGRGVLAVDPIGTKKLTMYHPCTWVAFLSFLSRSAGECEAAARSFPVTIRDRSESGPYSALRVRVEPSATPPAKAVASNFSVDALSFWVPGERGAWRQVDLARRGSSVDLATDSLRLDKGDQRTLTVRAESLSPGDYSGTLRFAAVGANEEAPEAKQTFSLQIRHHWTVSVLVAILGSLVGWFTSKYVVGVRRARALARSMQELRTRADFLARPDPTRTGWTFPSEATSYALARIRVLLHQLTLLSRSPLRVLVAEEEIRERSLDAQRRLSALETLRATRQRVQPVADGRPAAQVALGQLLRRATDLLDGPTFGDAQQADLARLVQGVESWLADATIASHYRDALLARLRGRELPDRSMIDECPDGPLRAELLALATRMPSVDAIGQATVPQLEGHDRMIAMLALLWREREMGWAPELASQCQAGATLDALFRIVDTGLWARLTGAAGQLSVERGPSGQQQVETYDLLEVRLATRVPGVSDARLVYHPLRVGWTIAPSEGQVRRAESDGLTLVQYFPSPGRVTIEAVLRWEGSDIAAPAPLTLEVVDNPDYRPRAFFGEWTEHAVTAAAALFAVVTAMSALYDSTFGSFGQYLSLFLWSAGAGAGGNLFKQLGTAPAPIVGGQADIALPTAAASPQR